MSRHLLLLQHLLLLLLSGLFFIFMSTSVRGLSLSHQHRHHHNVKHNIHHRSSSSSKRKWFKNKTPAIFELQEEEQQQHKHRGKSHSKKSKAATAATTAVTDACLEYHFDQTLDHFGSGIGPKSKITGESVTTFKQRYYICGEHNTDYSAENPIFFYVGNEAAVTTYIQYTGLMWELQSKFDAVLVFAEHRYYGTSLPYTRQEIESDSAKLHYLTTDQALADYAKLIQYLKANAYERTQTQTLLLQQTQKSAGTSASAPQSAWSFFATDSDSDADGVQYPPVIGFGGSYGGMLGAWLRMKYPDAIDGVIAGSAPILGVYGLIPSCSAYSFAETCTTDANIVDIDIAVMDGGKTADTNADAAAAVLITISENDLCSQNIQRGWDIVSSYAATASGRSELSDLFNLCSVPETEETALVVKDIISDAVTYMAMSSYPYASAYITSAVLGETANELPAYPLQYACDQYLNAEFETDADQLRAISELNSVFWESSSDACIDLDTVYDTYDDYIWNFLYCHSLLMPYGTRGTSYDMFWDSEWDATATIKWCNEEYDINVDVSGPASAKYGGRQLYKALSNVVFSNGGLDPWMPAGVLTDEDSGYSTALETVLIENAGHHLDLMFSNDNDMQSVIDAREMEAEYIAKWIDQVHDKYAIGMCASATAVPDTIVTATWLVQFQPWLTSMSALV